MCKMKKIIVMFLFASLIGLNGSCVLAKNKKNNDIDKPVTGDVTPKTVMAGALSLIVWPGIGQAINNDGGDKVLTHALLGLFPPYRFWSCYDAVVDRDGGYWDGRI